MPYPSSLSTTRGDIHFPTFLPDATRGVVRAVDAADLQMSGVQALVMNAFHLMLRPGSSTVQALGGLHNMCGWPGPIITDSGGFQAYSLIRQDPKQGSINENGVTFRRAGAKRKYQLSPEKTIQLQMNYGADILICLDDCTHVDDDPHIQQQAVLRTISWARRCRTEFDRLVQAKGLSNEMKPRLFAVVQGGDSETLRKQCADELLEIGFDGYGYGGWPLNSQGDLLTDALALTRELIPPELPMHALGVGHPKYVAKCAALGYQMFDSALPTRDARRGRLYTFTDAEDLTGDWYQLLYIQDQEHIRSGLPLSEHCDCHTCQNYSRGYLHHLFKINDHLFFRLATIHNLRFMHQLDDRLREIHG